MLFDKKAKPVVDDAPTYDIQMVSSPSSFYQSINVNVLHIIFHIIIYEFIKIHFTWVKFTLFFSNFHSFSLSKSLEFF